MSRIICGMAVLGYIHWPRTVTELRISHGYGSARSSPPSIPTPPISATRPYSRTVIAAARTAAVGALGGSRSSTTSIGSGDAACMAARSASTTPVSLTVLIRSPKRASRSASTAVLRPGQMTVAAPIARPTATPALPKFPVAPLTSSVSPDCRPAASRPP